MRDQPGPGQGFTLHILLRSMAPLFANGRRKGDTVEADAADGLATSGAGNSIGLLRDGSITSQRFSPAPAPSTTNEKDIIMSQRPDMAALFASATTGTGTAERSKLTKTLNSLAWRTRHSSAERYPLAINIPSQPSPVTFHVKQVQGGEIDGTGTGATVWPSSIVMIKYLELQTSKDPNFFKGKSVIDLGAGTCISSLACALLGARLVVATDGNDHCVELAASIVDTACSELEDIVGRTASGGDGDGGRAEGVEARHDGGDVSTPSRTSAGTGARFIGRGEVRVRKYSWGKDDLSILQETEQNPYDIILCSDCVLPKLYPIAPLVEAIAALSGPDTLTYVAYEHRYYSEFNPKTRFRELCERNGLVVNVIPHSGHHPSYCVDDIELWTVRRAACS